MAVALVLLSLLLSQSLCSTAGVPSVKLMNAAKDGVMMPGTASAQEASLSPVERRHSAESYRVVAGAGRTESGWVCRLWRPSGDR